MAHTPAQSSSSSCCDFCDILGPQKNPDPQSPSVDPLIRCFGNVNLGGSAGNAQPIMQAIRSFADVAYPQLGEPNKLQIVPDLSEEKQGMTIEDDMVMNLYTARGKAGGLLHNDPNLQYILSTHPEVKELLKKYEGEKAEVEVMSIILEYMKGREGAIIHGHKTGLSLVERRFREELKNQNVAADEIEKKVLTKMLEFFEVKTNDLAKMEKDAEDKVKQYFRYTGDKKIKKIKRTILTQRARIDGVKWEKKKREEDMETLEKVISEAKKTKVSKLDPKKAFLEAIMKKELNKYKREHDIMIIRPEYQILVNPEVKAVEDDVGRLNNVVQQGCKQVQNWHQHFWPIHGHLVGRDFILIGMLILPNVTIDKKQEICRRKKICPKCSPFIVVGNISEELPNVLNMIFPNPAPALTPNLRDQYKKLMERLISLQHLLPSVNTMEKIVGGNQEVIPGFVDEDEDNLHLLNCSPGQFVTSKHRGSPPSILFMNRLQLKVWRELRVAFLADYGVGKTTLLKSKAVSLGIQGDKTCFVFLGGADRELQPVMGVANEISLRSKPNMTVKSLCHLEQFYSEQHPSTSQTQNKTAMELLQYWIEYSTEGRATKHVFIDEAPVEIDRHDKVDVHGTCTVLADLASILTVDGYLWITYHSKVLRDTVSGGGFQSPDDLIKLQQEIKKKNIDCPQLRHNMRNCQQVAKTGDEVMSGYSASNPTAALDAALPPKYDCMDPPTVPLLIPCYGRDYKAAILKAYRTGLGVETGKEAEMSVVVLCSEIDSSEVMQVLRREGVSRVRYYNNTDRQELESFLTQPKGVLCTDQDTFTGMEANRVIWVHGGHSALTESRSAVLRTVSRLAIVSLGYDGGVRLGPGSVDVDTDFARCQEDSVGWECKDCGVGVCAHCCMVCHADCLDIAKSYSGGRCLCLNSSGINCSL